MPKGFNNKAIEGFTQWMTAIINETNMSRADADSLVRKTKTLLDEGFPKIRP
ncbi:MAG: hypothetical protein AABX47_07590 [Nanoarchaeota archaeon]